MSKLRALAGDIDIAIAALAKAVEAYQTEAKAERERLLGDPERSADLRFIADSDKRIRDVIRSHPPLDKLTGWNRHRKPSFAALHRN